MLCPRRRHKMHAVRLFIMVQSGWWCLCDRDNAFYFGVNVPWNSSPLFYTDCYFLFIIKCHILSCARAPPKASSFSGLFPQRRSVSLFFGYHTFPLERPLTKLMDDKWPRRGQTKSKGPFSSYKREIISHLPKARTHRMFEKKVEPVCAFAG